MDRYRIVESVGRRLDQVKTYDDLEIHHPTANSRGLRTGRPEDFERGRGRIHARVEGDVEEIRREPDGRVLVKKDFILVRDSGGPVFVPSPADGYVHYLRDRTQGVRVYDRPFGTPGARLLAQSLHMDPRSFDIPEGGHVSYGQPLGRMSDTGSPRAVHAHVECEPAQFRRYIQDIVDGTIAPDRWPGRSPDVTRASPPPAAAARSARDNEIAPPRPMSTGIEPGDRGPEVRDLQRTLNRLGVRDAQGQPLVEDGDFGRRTRDAVESFQREHGLPAVGRVGPRTRAALDAPHGPRVTGTGHPDHALFERVLGHLQGAESARGLPSGPHSLNLAAALVVQMREAGLTRADRVELNDTARLARVVQADASGLRELERTTMPVDTREASRQSIHAASDRLAELRHSYEAEPRRAQAPALAR